MKLKIICQFCNKEFERYPSRKAKFCSNKCANNSGDRGFQKGHKINLGKKYKQWSLESKEKRRLNGNPNWKGEQTKYRSKHTWIIRNFGKADECEECHKIKKSYDWSNIDHKYKRGRKNWRKLCRSCHQKYDYKMGLRTKPYAIKKSQENKRKTDRHII